MTRGWEITSTRVYYPSGAALTKSDLPRPRSIGQQDSQLPLHGVQHWLAPQTVHQRPRGLVLTAAQRALQVLCNNRMQTTGCKQQPVEQIGAPQPGARCAVSSYNVQRDLPESVHLQLGMQRPPGPPGDVLHGRNKGSDQVTGKAVADQLYADLFVQRGVQDLSQPPGQPGPFSLQSRFCVRNACHTGPANRER